MQRVLAAELAVLFELEPALQGFLVFMAVVSNTFALSAFEFHEIILGHNNWLLAISN